MSKIKFKLKSVCTTYVKDIKGKLYKLNPGLNTLELERDDYVSLATALGIRVKHKSDTVAKDSSDSINHNEHHVSESDQQPTVKDIVDDTAKDTLDNTDKYTVDDVVKDSVDDVDKNTVDGTSNSDTTDTADIDTNDEVVDDLDNSDVIDYSSWSYNKLKSEYKKITGTNCRLKKGDVIAFLQEHSNV